MLKRNMIRFAFAGAVTLVLAGCSEKQSAAERSGKPETKKVDPLKIAFVYVSPASDEGWSRQHDLARIELEKEYGNRIAVTTVENIPAGADCERVLRDLALQGNKLIFATSFGYMNAILKVAQEFPEVKFEHATGYKTTENVGNYTARFYEGRYLAGKLAGAMTKTNVLGYVAALPIPEVLQGINAYTLGVKSVNPKAVVRAVWTSSWYDPGKESDAAKSLVGLRADILTHHTDSPAVVTTAEDLKVPVISYNTAMKRLAPKMLLAGVVQSWHDYYASRIEAVMNGTWKPDSVWGGIPEHMMDLVDIRSDVPQAVIDDIRAAYEAMASRKLHPFMGPLKTNEGRAIVPAGRAATDQELLTMDWLVEGVIGKLPTV